MNIVFSKTNCPNCDLTKRDMDILGIPYKLVNVEEDEKAMQDLITEGFKQMPVVKADNRAWSGYDQEKIKSLVHY